MKNLNVDLSLYRYNHANDYMWKQVLKTYNTWHRVNSNGWMKGDWTEIENILLGM